MEVIYAYLIATHGPRKLDKRHPALRQQIANLRAYATINAANLHLSNDYARTVHGLEDLPALAERLPLAIETSSTFVMDDLSRLFRPCVNQAARERLAAELEPFAGSLHGLRQGMSLADLPSVNRSLVVSAALSSKYVLAPTSRAKRSKEELSDQTAAANSASAQSRRETADVKARELARIRESLSSEIDHVTNRMIADQANASGLRTTRGGNWRHDTVARTLKRLNTLEK